MGEIVEAELRTGVEKNPNPAKARYETERFLGMFQILPFDSACACAYARIRAELEAREAPIGPMDMLIAATASAHFATVVTNNDHEFARVEGLPVQAWAEMDWGDSASLYKQILREGKVADYEALA